MRGIAFQSGAVKHYFLSLLAGTDGTTETACIVVGTDSGVGTFGPPCPFSTLSTVGGGCERGRRPRVDGMGDAPCGERAPVRRDARSVAGARADSA